MDTSTMNFFINIKLLYGDYNGLHIPIRNCQAALECIGNAYKTYYDRRNANNGPTSYRQDESGICSSTDARVGTLPSEKRKDNKGHSPRATNFLQGDCSRSCSCSSDHDRQSVVAGGVGHCSRVSHKSGFNRPLQRPDMQLSKHRAHSESTRVRWGYVRVAAIRKLPRETMATECSSSRSVPSCLSQYSPTTTAPRRIILPDAGKSIGTPSPLPPPRPPSPSRHSLKHLQTQENHVLTMDSRDQEKDEWSTGEFDQIDTAVLKADLYKPFISEGHPRLQPVMYPGSEEVHFNNSGSQPADDWVFKDVNGRSGFEANDVCHQNPRTNNLEARPRQAEAETPFSQSALQVPLGSDQRLTDQRLASIDREALNPERYALPSPMARPYDPEFNFGLAQLSQGNKSSLASTHHDTNQVSSRPVRYYIPRPLPSLLQRPIIDDTGESSPPLPPPPPSAALMAGSPELNITPPPPPLDIDFPELSPLSPIQLDSTPTQNFNHLEKSNLPFTEPEWIRRRATLDDFHKMPGRRTSGRTGRDSPKSAATTGKLTKSVSWKALDTIVTDDGDEISGLGVRRSVSSATMSTSQPLPGGREKELVGILKKGGNRASSASSLVSSRDSDSPMTAVPWYAIGTQALVPQAGSSSIRKSLSTSAADRHLTIGGRPLTGPVRGDHTGSIIGGGRTLTQTKSPQTEPLSRRQDEQQPPRISSADGEEDFELLSPKTSEKARERSHSHSPHLQGLNHSSIPLHEPQSVVPSDIRDSPLDDGIRQNRRSSTDTVVEKTGDTWLTDKEMLQERLQLDGHRFMWPDPSDAPLHVQTTNNNDRLESEPNGASPTQMVTEAQRSPSAYSGYLSSPGSVTSGKAFYDFSDSSQHSPQGSVRLKNSSMLSLTQYTPGSVGSVDRPIDPLYDSYGSFPLLTLEGEKSPHRVHVPDTAKLFQRYQKPFDAEQNSSDVDEAHSTDTDDDEDDTVRCAACGKCDLLEVAEACFRTCSGCYTHYCGTACRRADWSMHKKKCLLSHMSSLCRGLARWISGEEELWYHCSRFARTCYLSQGRGAVMLVFSSAQAAGAVLKSGRLRDCALYLSLKEVESYQFDLTEDRKRLTDNCRQYDPELKFVLHMAIRVKGLQKLPAPRCRSKDFHRTVRMRLSTKHFKQITREQMEDTLLLTAVPLHDERPISSRASSPRSSPTRSITEDQDDMAIIDPHENKRSRELFFVNVQTQLREKGISLRHQYPIVYNALIAFVSEKKPFAPLLFFATNARTRKRFMCCILPCSEPDSSWSSDPRLLEELDLALEL